MAISDTLTGTDPTPSGTVAGEVSLLHVSGDFVGLVKLQVAPPGTTDWLTIDVISKPESYPINTPNITALYRFTSELNSGSAKVYLGG